MIIGFITLLGFILTPVTAVVFYAFFWALAHAAQNGSFIFFSFLFLITVGFVIWEVTKLIPYKLGNLIEKVKN